MSDISKRTCGECIRYADLHSTCDKVRDLIKGCNYADYEMENTND